MITPRDLVFYAKKKGLTAVAVTDHNCVEGALKIAKETDFPIIPGIEIDSLDGHIVGLNVKEIIPRRLSATETAERIHTAGGVAIACHPYALFKGSLGKNVCSEFDAIEVINARAFPFKRSVKKANETAERLKLSRVAGTDAHYGPQVGYGYTVIDADLNIEAIMKAIVNGHCEAYGEPVPVFLNLRQQFQRLQRLTKKLRSK